MQNVIVLDLLIGVEMNPALPAFILRPGIPLDRQSLDASVGKFDQILLKLVDAERVFHLKDGQLPVGPIGFDQEFPVLAEKALSYVVVFNTVLVKIAQHGFIRGMTHFRFVLLGPPQVRFGLMTAGAGFAADERGNVISAARATGTCKNCQRLPNKKTSTAATEPRPGFRFCRENSAGQITGQRFPSFAI